MKAIKVNKAAIFWLKNKQDPFKSSCGVIRLFWKHQTLSQKAKQNLIASCLAGILPEHISGAFSLGYHMLKRRQISENSEGGNQHDKLFLGVAKEMGEGGQIHSPSRTYF